MVLCLCALFRTTWPLLVIITSREAGCWLLCHIAVACCQVHVLAGPYMLGLAVSMQWSGSRLNTHSALLRMYSVLVSHCWIIQIHCMCQMSALSTSMLDVLTVGPKFTPPACYMLPTMCIACHYMALLLLCLLPLGQTNGQTDTALFIRFLHRLSS